MSTCLPLGIPQSTGEAKPGFIKPFILHTWHGVWHRQMWKEEKERRKAGTKGRLGVKGKELHPVGHLQCENTPRKLALELLSDLHGGLLYLSPPESL